MRKLIILRRNKPQWRVCRTACEDESLISVKPAP